jgi:sigma-E factor negative regulatory protein RseB
MNELCSVKWCLGALCLGFVFGPLYAADSPSYWVTRMGETLRLREYEGTFVYVHDSRLEAMRISRQIGSEGATERLTSLTGERRELFKRGDEVRCVTSAGVLTANAFSRIESLADSLEKTFEASSSYQWSIAGQDRVAGFDAIVIDAAPIDDSRYGYRLWIDRESGMFLGSAMMTLQGKPIEQIMFTQLQLHQLRVEHAESKSPKKQDQVSDGRIQKPSHLTQSLESAVLPKGFRLVASGVSPSHTQHYVYSDGLANLSIYIEPKSLGFVGAIRRGSINAYGLTRANQHVVVMGDLPGPVVRRIAYSLPLDP